MQVTQQHYEKFVEVANQGLCSGMGTPEPGKMCIEAAWCYALGLPHGDDPGCVGKAVRRFKIRLNDSCWSSNEARAKGMLRLGIAQIGSDALDQKEFVKRIAEQTIRRILPIALHTVAKRIPEHAERLTDAALRCEREGTIAAAKNAQQVARNAAASAASAASAAYAAYADAAADAADAAADAADAAAAYAAYADAAADADAAAVKRDEILALTADLATEILIDMKSPGCAYLHLAQATGSAP